MNSIRSKSCLKGFTLIELLFILLIITMLVGMLLPAIFQSRQQALCVKCESNLRQIGIMMLMYANDHDGFLFPTHMGYQPGNINPFPDTGAPGTVHNVWTTRVFNNVWNPPIMICPADRDPTEKHSYVLNAHLGYWNMKYSSRLPDGQSPSDIVLMGEKITKETDFYMSYGDYQRVVEKYRHGLKVGSNYLMLDLHVETSLPFKTRNGLDPWDFSSREPPAKTEGL